MNKKTIYVKSYGCQMNVYDSKRIKDLFTSQGYKINELNKTKLVTKEWWV